MSNIFLDLTNYENLYEAYKITCRGKTKYSTQALIFSQNETKNILDLQAELKAKRYQPLGFNEFKVYEPKERLVHAPQYRDKIVQYSIYSALSKVYNPKFINDSYASISNKGTHKCLEQIQKYMRIAKREYGDKCYIVKADVSKFFYSIDRDLMKERLKIKIKEKDLLDLLYTVIDSAGTISEKGLPLGNTSSQVFANIYMDKLDKYCKNKLGLKYYIRYMDDIFIACKDKDHANEVLNLITFYLENSLHLIFNPKKTKIFPIAQGVNMVGFSIKTTHRKIRQESKARIKKKSKKISKLYTDGRITKEKSEAILNSWLNHAKHGDCNNLINALSENKCFVLKDGLYRMEG